SSASWRAHCPVGCGTRRAGGFLRNRRNQRDGQGRRRFRFHGDRLMLGALIFVAIAGLAWFAGLRGRNTVLVLAVPWLSVVLLKSQMPEAWLARQFGGDIRHWLLI